MRLFLLGFVCGVAALSLLRSDREVEQIAAGVRAYFKEALLA